MEQLGSLRKTVVAATRDVPLLGICLGIKLLSRRKRLPHAEPTVLSVKSEKRILNPHTVNDLPVLHVLRVECCAAGFRGCCDDEPVIQGISVPLADAKRRTVSPRRLGEVLDTV